MVFFPLEVDFLFWGEAEHFSSLGQGVAVRLLRMQLFSSRESLSQKMLLLKKRENEEDEEEGEGDEDAKFLFPKIRFLPHMEDDRGLEREYVLRDRAQATLLGLVKSACSPLQSFRVPSEDSRHIKKPILDKNETTFSRGPKQG